MSKIPDELWKEKNPALRGTQSSEPATGCNPEAMQGGCNERISTLVIRTEDIEITWFHTP